MSRNWTPDQYLAIHTHGGDLLISAAAGSGKTAVLTERVLNLITDPVHPVDIDRLLIVTFSNAAAEEMRQRIAKRLYEKIEDEPENSALRRQVLLLGNAEICTIHAFCYRLIRENFQYLGLPGDLRLADESEIKLLEQTIADELLEEEYEKGEEVFFRLVELLSGSRNDSKVAATLLTLYQFLRNHPYYEDWADRFLNAEADLPFDETPWAKILRDYALAGARYAEELLKISQGECALTETLAKKVAPVINEDLAMVQRLCKVLEEESWDACCEKTASVTFPAFPRISDPESVPFKDRILSRRNETKKIIGKLKTDLFLMSEAQYRADCTELQPIIRKLMQLVLEFDRRFTEEKVLRGKLDFSDLEHGALRLLHDRSTDRPTALAQALSCQYSEIMIDEYQDTNALQEQIFAMIAAGGVPRFMVGDVKQSIYRFRQACPENFLEKKKNYPLADGEHFPAKIALSANFRTRREITGFVNELFASIMNPEVGEMDYLPEDALVSSLPYDYSIKRPVTVLGLKAPKEWPIREVRSAEARRIAEEIDTLLKSGFTVEENGVHRPLQAGDICILLRSAKDRAEDYLRALSQLQIPAHTVQKEGLLASREVKTVLSYLRILANPMLDLELAEVLCSPMYGCSGDDLAKARLHSRYQNLYLTVGEKEMQKNPRFAAFWADYSYLRGRMQSVSSAELIRSICERTGFEEKCRVRPDGKFAVANLHLLAEYAFEHEKNGRAENDFADYLTRLAEHQQDLKSAANVSGGSVLVMTIHSSKGLEFPVVFLAGCRESLQHRSDNADIALNRELGFACKLRDNRAMRQHKTLALAAMQLENRRASLSEEMRILYVALTRAREKLYLVAAGSKWEENELEQCTAEGRKMSPFWVRTANSYWEWMLPTIRRLPEQVEIVCDDLYEREEITESPRVCEDTAEEADAVMLQKMHRNMAYVYPYEQDTKTPRRVAVSELAERETHQEFLLRRRPKCLTRQELTAAEKGTVAHKVMQFADYAALAADADAEMQRLVTEGYLYREEGEQLDPAMVLQLLRSPLGERLLKAERIHREIRFLQEFTPEELQAVDPSLVIAGKTLIMGAVDCVLQEGSKAVIIDYKTDRVKDPEELRQRYAAQIRLYRAIVERQLGLSVEEMLLYSFHLGVAIPVSIG